MRASGALVLALGVSALASAAPVQSLGPVLGATTWLNGRPNEAALRGKVVLLDVFTVDCYNCKNVTPNLRKLSRTEPGLAIVGIHTPETRYERERAHVVASLHDLGVTWPVAIDDDSRLWNAYGVESWPTQLIFDRKGHLRKTVIGDSQDNVVDETVRKLLAE